MSVTGSRSRGELQLRVLVVQTRIELLHSHDVANRAWEEAESLGSEFLSLLWFGDVVDGKELDFTVFGGEDSKLALFAFSASVKRIVEKNAISPLLRCIQQTIYQHPKEEKEREGRSEENKNEQ